MINSNHLFTNLLMTYLLLFMRFSPLCAADQNDDQIPADSVSIDRLLDLAYTLEIENPDTALFIYQQIILESPAIPYKMAFGRAHLYSGIVHSDQGEFEEAIGFFLDALEIFEEQGYLKGVAAAHVNLGNIDKRRALYGRAIEYYLEGTKVFEKIGDTLNLIYTYSNVGALLSELELYDRSLYYNRQSADLSKSIGDSVRLGNALINIGQIYILKEQLDSAKIIYDDVLMLAERQDDPILLYLGNNNASTIANLEKDFERALTLSKKTLDVGKLINNPAYVSNAEVMLGQVHYNLGDLDSARYYLSSGLALAKEYESMETYLNGLEKMIVLEEKSSNFASALAYSNEFIKLKEEQAGIKKNKIVAGLEIQFESEKKDLRLEAQTLEIEKNKAEIVERNYLITALVLALLVLILVFSLLRSRLARKKRQAEYEAELNMEKVENLKREKEVSRLTSMLEGEDQERSRLAKDLHDGLGGMLSATKMRFDQIRKSSPELCASLEYSNAIAMIDQTSAETRRISHNLMPGSLEKFGLHEALKDLCSNIEASTSIAVSLETIGQTEKLSTKIEKNLYRIIQEITNNALKYSKANEMIIQLMAVEKQLHITVEDNGIGFEKDEIVEGIGMRSIRSRVELLKGTFEISSQPNEGSSFRIIIPII